MSNLHLQDYRRIAKKQRMVVSEAIKHESVAKQRRILEDYDRVIASNIKLLVKDGLLENWEAYCFYASPAELVSELRNDKSSDIILNEKVSNEAVNFFTGGLKSQAVFLNNVENYLDQVMELASEGEFPILQAGLEKAKNEVQAVSNEMEDFFKKSSGEKGVMGKLSTLPQRFLSKIGAGSTKDYQLEYAFFDKLVAQSLVERKGYLGYLMSQLDENLIQDTLLESKFILNEQADPVSITRNLSSMGQLVGEIIKMAAKNGGRELTRVDIASLANSHPDIQRSTLENIIHLTARNTQGLSGDPSQLNADTFYSVGRAMFPDSPFFSPTVRNLPAPTVPGVPDGGGSFLTWLHNLWVKAMTFAKGVYAKLYAYLAPKILAIKAWLASVFKGGIAAAKGGIAAAKGLLGKAGSWLGGKLAAFKAGGGVVGAAGKGLAALKAGATGLAGLAGKGLAGLGAAALSPAAAGLAAVGGAAAAGKSLYSLMSRRGKLQNVYDFVNSLKNVANASIKEGLTKLSNLISESQMFAELFEAEGEAEAAPPVPETPKPEESAKAKEVSKMVKLYAATMKKYVDVDSLAAELDTEEGHELLNKIKAVKRPEVPVERSK
jgi:hypothetical protein